MIDEEKFPYKDLLDWPRPDIWVKEKMSMASRAAQFAPFAALSGFDSAVHETSRYTDKKIELTDDEMYLLDEKLRIIQERINETPIVQVTYFKADKKKAGGIYVTSTGTVRKIDDFAHELVLMDMTVIPIEDIITLTSETMSKYFDV